MIAENSEGFSLVEVLVALSIFTLVVTSVYTSFSTGLKIRQRSRVHMGKLQEARQLVSSLKDDLANLSPLVPQLRTRDNNVTLLRNPRRHVLDSEPSSHPILVRYSWLVGIDGSRTYSRAEFPLKETARDSAGLEAIFGFFDDPGNSMDISLLTNVDLPAGLDMSGVFADEWEMEFQTLYPSIKNLQATLSRNEAVSSGTMGNASFTVGIASETNSDMSLAGTLSVLANKEFKFETSLPVPVLRNEAMDEAAEVLDLLAPQTSE